MGTEAGSFQLAKRGPNLAVKRVTTWHGRVARPRFSTGQVSITFDYQQVRDIWQFLMRPLDYSRVQVGDQDVGELFSRPRFFVIGHQVNLLLRMSR